MERRHFVLMTQGTLGDLFPFMRLGRALQARSHHVTVATHGGYRGHLQEWGLEALALDRPEDFATNALGVSETGGSVMEETPAALVRRTLSQVQQQATTLVQALADLPAGQRVVLVGHMNMLPTTLMAAERFQIPCVSIFPAPYFVDILRAYVDMAPVFHYFNPLRAQLGLPSVSAWLPLVRSVRLGLGLWPDWFAVQEQRWLLPCQPLGFMLPDKQMFSALPPELAPLLAQRPIVITHSSSLPASDSFFRLTIEACASWAVPLLVVTPHQDFVRALPVETAHWFPQLPFGDVLPHARLIIHHGGIGTCAQALAAGTPQLILAHGWDRPDNATRLQRLGVARYLPKPQWRAEPINEALRHLLSDSVAAQCDAMRARMAGATPLEDACAALERL